MPKRQSMGERLKGAISDRHVYVEDGAYVGIAEDGTEIVLGYYGNERSIEKYLRRFPGPKEW